MFADGHWRLIKALCQMQHFSRQNQSSELHWQMVLQLNCNTWIDFKMQRFLTK